MLKIKGFVFILFILTAVVLSACNENKDYEIVKSETKVTEYENELQLELEYTVVNHSDEDYAFTFVFPSYVQDDLLTEVGTVDLPANGRAKGLAVIAISKDGGEMSEQTIEAILDGEIPITEEILIGKKVSLN